MTSNINEPNKKRGIYILPNLFTISALFAGFYAIISSLNGHYSTAAFAMFIAMLMDSLDGRVARLTNTQTEFGAQLDSLSDIISFGVTPALVAYNWILSDFGKIGWLVAFLYTVSVALRLARFNTQLGKSDKRYFQGLACTPAAGVIAGFIWTFNKLGIVNWGTGILVIVLMLGISTLMVSNVRFRSFKDLDLKNNVSFLTILFIVLAIVLIAVDPPQILFTIFFIYAISGPILTLKQLRKTKKLKKTKRKKTL